MGAIRGFFVVFVSTLLFLSIFSSILFLTLSSSLSYPTIQKESKEVVRLFLEENMNINAVIYDAYPFMQVYCQTNSEYVFSAQEFAFTIPCNITLEGRESILDKGIDYLTKGIYYKEYECNFVDCFKKTEIPMFIFSVKTYNFLNNLFYLSLIILLLLLIMIFFLMEKKTNVPILVGSLFIILSVLFFKIDSLINLIPNEIAVKIVGLFFSKSFSISIKILIAGIILLIIGIVFKIFKTGFSISDFLSKLKNPITKETKKIVKTKSK